MKTLMTANGPIRVKDEDARDMINGTGRFQKGDYEYCPKSEWKKTRPKPKKK
jgi:hypothetical protein